MALAHASHLYRIVHLMIIVSAVGVSEFFKGHYIIGLLVGVGPWALFVSLAVADQRKGQTRGWRAYRSTIVVLVVWFLILAGALVFDKLTW